MSKCNVISDYTFILRVDSFIFKIVMYLSSFLCSLSQKVLSNVDNKACKTWSHWDLFLPKVLMKFAVFLQGHFVGKYILFNMSKTRLSTIK